MNAKGRLGAVVVAAIVGGGGGEAFSAEIADDVWLELDARGEVVVHLDYRVPETRSWAEQLRAVAAGADAIVADLDGTDFEELRRFSLVNGLTLRVAGDALRRLGAHPLVIGVDEDMQGQLHLNQARPLAEIDAVHVAGFEGLGVTVGIIDSGFDRNHVDLGSPSAEQCYCLGGCCPNQQATQSGSGAARDANGHGTHVGGIVTSDGTTTPLGFAPEADVVAVRVLGSSGVISMTDVISGLDWIALNQPDVDVVNMSLGSFTRFAGDCDTANSATRSLATAVGNLAAVDVPCFSSSGNDADSSGMVAPACVAEVISVGSVYDANVGGLIFGSCTDATTAADQIACYSNVSSTLDVLAPGGAIASTDLVMGQVTRHGTSMASPAAAACAALLVESNPNITLSELESAIETSATTLTDSRVGRSYPRLDCDSALAEAAPDTDGDGFRDPSDNCPAISNPTQADRDVDGLGDVCDDCPDDDANDADADGVCGDVDNCPEDANSAQDDGDTDGLGDVCDACPADPENDVDEDTICGDVDNCPALANPSQADDDEDGAGNGCDPCRNDPDDDADADGACADVDNCPTEANADQADADEDGAGDVCDACPADAEDDADADGVCGDVDNCPAAANAEQVDGDEDGAGDACDACPADPGDDADADGTCGDLDNCPVVANPDQADADADGAGDACDVCPADPDDDADADGVCGDVDNCPAAANPDQADADSDGAGDDCDPCPTDDDTDEDGACDRVDNCVAVANAAQTDRDGDGAGDACDVCPGDPTDDADGDGICEDADNCPGLANASQDDRDGDGVGDACAPLEASDGGCRCVPVGRSAPSSLALMLALGGLLGRRRPRSRVVRDGSLAATRPEAGGAAAIVRGRQVASGPDPRRRDRALPPLFP